MTMLIKMKMLTIYLNIFQELPPPVKLYVAYTQDFPLVL
jgi:hypothetical protein